MKVLLFCVLMFDATWLCGMDRKPCEKVTVTFDTVTSVDELSKKSAQEKGEEVVKGRALLKHIFDHETTEKGCTLPCCGHLKGCSRLCCVGKRKPLQRSPSSNDLLAGMTSVKDLFVAQEKDL